MDQVFEFKDYKAYLAQALGTTGAQRGIRSKLAHHLGCQVSFLSQVLNGNTHISLEHAMRISRFLQHTKDEAQYFLLLVEEGRAGTKDLKDFFKEQMETILEKRKEIRGRIKSTEVLDLEAQTKYYSAWYYAAIHVALSIPELQTPQALSENLKLPLLKITSALEFLQGVGLAVLNKGKYEIGPTRIHLSHASSLISNHHTNWRLQSLQSLEKEDPENLHYSSVYSLAKNDIPKIRQILVETIEKLESQILKSKEQELICINLDLFKP